MFLYQKNLQGDITGIIGPDGQLMASYAYDAYGMVIPLPTIGDSLSVLVSIIFIIVNPILYRGYICTQLGDQICYYLGSRFYHPQLGRFMNADKHTDTGTGVNGTNMFAYCNNNPLIFVYPTGERNENIEETPSGLSGAIVILLALMLCPSLLLIYIQSPGQVIIPDPYLFGDSTIQNWQQQNCKIADEVIESLSDTFSRSLLSSKRQMHSIVNHIAKALSKLKDIPHYKSATETHHIVAQNSVNALIARRYLNAVGFTTEYSLNLIDLKTFLHKVCIPMIIITL